MRSSTAGCRSSPSTLKRILDDFAVEAGVELRFFTRVIEAEARADGRIDGVVLSNVEGLRFVRAKAFVDATGDAALAALAGAECKVVLRDTDAVAPSTLCSLFGGMNWDDPAYGERLARHRRGEEPHQERAAAQAIADGHFTQDDRFMPGMNKIGERAASSMAATCST